ncbi:hypothetical protein CSW50_02505, partial [Thermus scotoductus]
MGGEKAGLIPLPKPPGEEVKPPGPALPGAEDLAPPPVPLPPDGAQVFLPPAGWPSGVYLLARGLGQADDARLRAPHPLLREDAALHALLADHPLTALRTAGKATLTPTPAP